MHWRKLGCIVAPTYGFDWMQTHAMCPTADHVSDDLYRIYFSGRDNSNRSRIGYAEVDLHDPPRLIQVSKQPVLSLGELGCFDDNGVTPSWIVSRNGRKFLYYIGWRPRATTRMSVIAGLAISDDGGLSFSRASRAPLLRLTDSEPFSILTAPCVLNDGEMWKMWYVSGTGWVNPDLPRYNIKYAESTDGMVWSQSGTVCIDANSLEETALARPCVIMTDGKYRMWYSWKVEGGHYRIGYAESDDGISWIRLDDHAGIETSDSGWDSEMIEYAYVFSHKNKRYMLYNGNNYGHSGFGLAVAD